MSGSRKGSASLLEARLQKALDRIRLAHAAVEEALREERGDFQFAGQGRGEGGLRGAMDQRNFTTHWRKNFSMRFAFGREDGNQDAIRMIPHDQQRSQSGHSKAQIWASILAR